MYRAADGVRQIMQVAGYNYRQWKKNPRIIMTFALSFTVCFLLSDKALDFSAAYAKSMQAAEPFIWTFGDAGSIMIISMLLILLFSDIPMLNAGVPFYLMRTTKRRWILGQIAYVCTVTALYMLFVLASTAVICAKNCFPGNMWSATGAILGYSGLGENLHLPIAVKVMEFITPYECMLQIILLMLLYSISMVLVMLVLNLKWGKRAGITGGILYSLYGLLLSPDTVAALLKIPEEQMFRANVILGWISPLNHATYKMHNFGYDRLPTLEQSYMVFIGLILLLGLLALYLIKIYNFSFVSSK